MVSANNYKYITAAATTTLAGTEVKRICLHGIFINKTMTGTLTILSGGGSGTTIGVIAATTVPGAYWVSTNGVEIENPAFTNGSTEDITIVYTNIG